MAYSVVLQELIRDICTHHEAFSKEFMDENEKINYKKRYVRDIIDDKVKFVTPEFSKRIGEYCRPLNNLSASSYFESQYSECDIRSRTKQFDRAVGKLLHYRYGKNELGATPLNRCLNDLLGFRVHLDQFDHQENNIHDFCEGFSKEYKIYSTDRSNGSYKATHIYFLGNNYYFPWELQIWNSSDIKANDESHKEHREKRAYINELMEYSKHI